MPPAGEARRSRRRRAPGPTTSGRRSATPQFSPRRPSRAVARCVPRSRCGCQYWPEPGDRPAPARAPPNARRRGHGRARASTSASKRVSRSDVQAGPASIGSSRIAQRTPPGCSATATSDHGPRRLAAAVQHDRRRGPSVVKRQNEPSMPAPCVARRIAERQLGARAPVPAHAPEPAVRSERAGRALRAAPNSVGQRGAAAQRGDDALGHRRPVLEAVARAAAEDPARRRSAGCARGDEVRVRRQLVAAGLRPPFSGASASAGKRRRAYARAVRLALRADRRAASASGLDRRALGVAGDLDAEVVDVAGPVGGEVVVDPARDVAATPGRRRGRSSSWRVTRRSTRPGKRSRSQPPHAQITTPASRRAPSSSHRVRPRGGARARAPSACAGA